MAENLKHDHKHHFKNQVPGNNISFLAVFCHFYHIS